MSNKSDKNEMNIWSQLKQRADEEHKLFSVVSFFLSWKNLCNKGGVWLSFFFCYEAKKFRKAVRRDTKEHDISKSSNLWYSLIATNTMCHLFLSISFFFRAPFALRAVFSELFLNLSDFPSQLSHKNTTYIHFLWRILMFPLKTHERHEDLFYHR